MRWTGTNVSQSCENRVSIQERAKYGVGETLSGVRQMNGLSGLKKIGDQQAQLTG
jgi:hypothetical protein